MKRQFALLFALTFMVSGMASMAEEPAAERITELTEAAETEWTAPFEDGEWLSVPEWNAEVYLPMGWALTEVTETGFIAADGEGESSLTVTMEEFAAEENTEVKEESDSAELSAFEEYLLGLGQEYELALMGDTEAAVFTGEEDVQVKFPMNGLLVTMAFTPAEEGGIADSALSIAETFYLYAPAEAEIEEEAE